MTEHADFRMMSDAERTAAAAAAAAVARSTRWDRQDVDDHAAAYAAAAAAAEKAAAVATRRMQWVLKFRADERAAGRSVDVFELMASAWDAERKAAGWAKYHADTMDGLYDNLTRNYR